MCLKNGWGSECLAKSLSQYVRGGRLMPGRLCGSVSPAAGILAARIGVKKVTIGMIQKLVAMMLLLLGSLLVLGII